MTTLDPLANADVRHQLQDLANDTDKLALQMGRPDQSQRIRLLARRFGASTMQVAVAGDVKVGKSTLVNAITGLPGLLPTDSDVATAVTAVVEPGEAEVIEARAISGGEPFALHIDRLHATIRGEGAPADLVRITVPSGALAGSFAIMDTPGSGGVTFSHRDRALAAAGTADLCLVCLAADSPVSASAMDFIAEVTTRCNEIWLVATKADHPSAGEIIDENLIRLRRHLTSVDDPAIEQGLRLIVARPLWRTAAAMAVDEHRRPAADIRRLQRSGVPSLIDAIRRSSAGIDGRRLEALGQMIGSVLDELSRQVDRTLQAVDGERPATPSPGDEDRAVRTRHSKWRTDYAQLVSEVQGQARSQLEQRLVRIERSYANTIATMSRSEVADLDHRIDAELAGSIRAAFNALVVETGERMERATLESLADFSCIPPPPLLAYGTAERDIRLPDIRAEFLVAERSRTSRLDLVFDFGASAMTVVGAMGVGGLAAGSPVMLPLFALNLVRKYVLSGTRQRQTDLGTVISRTLSAIRSDLLNDLTFTINRWQVAVVNHVNESVEGYRDLLQRQHRELAELERKSAATRRDQRQVADRQHATIISLRARLPPLVTSAR